jgi:hypothetical protein
MPGGPLTSQSSAEVTTEKTHVFCLFPVALCGSHKLFNFVGNKVFSVVHRFVQCLGFSASRETAPVLNHAFSTLDKMNQIVQCRMAIWLDIRPYYKYRTKRRTFISSQKVSSQYPYVRVEFEQSRPYRFSFAIKRTWLQAFIFR